MLQRESMGRLALLATLYFSQGLPFGFFTQALPVFLRERGVSLAAIGLTSLLYLPWALKFAWAPFVDRASSRKRWILPLQWSAAALMVVLGSLDFTSDTGMLLILAGVVVANLLAATQDIATDGLAVDILTPDERGPGNGVQVAAYRLGMMVGGGALLVAFAQIGWGGAFGAMSGLLVLATLPILLYREGPRRPSAVRDAGWWPTLRSFVTSPGMATWLLALVAYKGADAMASHMARPLLVDLGYTKADIGRILGLGGSVAGLLGALVGGVGVRVVGRRAGLLGFGMFQAVAVGGYLAFTETFGGPPTEATVWAVMMLDTFAGGTATAALFTLMMDACRPGTEGSDYTLQASAVVLGTGVTASVSGAVVEAIGWPVFFASTSVATALGVLLAVRLISRPQPP